MKSFDIAVCDGANGKKHMRVWDKSKLLESVNFLKRMNARGHDVYVKPHGEHGLVFIDGLTPKGLQALTINGFGPALTLETQPGHFQAWVKLSEQPVSAHLREVVAKCIAKKFGGSLEVIIPFGRLAGFTNQEASSDLAGRLPFVLVQGSTGQVSEQAFTYLRNIQQTITAGHQSAKVYSSDRMPRPARRKGRN